ncbi:DUF6233 domain-containing protein [Streptomyces sp. DH10]|uniref:DUF6233 domain-containing protein n=1 Tax=Streptomyces sp. DH10 TaxID=3040121 RepID=UPI00301585DE
MRSGTRPAVHTGPVRPSVKSPLRRRWRRCSQSAAWRRRGCCARRRPTRRIAGRSALPLIRTLPFCGPRSRWQPEVRRHAPCSPRPSGWVLAKVREGRGPAPGVLHAPDCEEAPQGALLLDVEHVLNLAEDPGTRLCRAVPPSPLVVHSDVQAPTRLGGSGRSLSKSLGEFRPGAAKGLDEGVDRVEDVLSGHRAPATRAREVREVARGLHSLLGCLLHPGPGLRRQLHNHSTTVPLERDRCPSTSKIVPCSALIWGDWVGCQWVRLVSSEPGVLSREVGAARRN